jgi:hypothetical protein
MRVRNNRAEANGFCAVAFCTFMLLIVSAATILAAQVSEAQVTLMPDDSAPGNQPNFSNALPLPLPSIESAPSDQGSFLGQRSEARGHSAPGSHGSGAQSPMILIPEQ